MPLYHQPRLLRRTLKVLEKDNHHFFVHVDAKSRDYHAFEEAVSGIGNVHLIRPRIKVYHASISQINAILALLKAALDDDADFDFYHLISGQDYPLRSNEQFDRFFEQTTHSFMYFDTGDFLRSMQSEYRRCVDEFHFNNTHCLYSRIYERLRLGRLLRPFCRRKPINGLYGGWDWFTWNHATATFVVDYLREHPDYLRRFNHTASPTEHLFSTLLHPHTEQLGIEPQNPLRYVSWHPHRPIQTNYRPYNLNELDFESVVNSTCFFCRKIDERESGRLMDMIDAQRGSDFDMYPDKPIFV